MSLHRKKKVRPSKTIAQRETPSHGKEHQLTPNFELGFQQSLAMDGLSAFLKAQDQDFYLLKGYAGTGKSTLCTLFLSQFETGRVRLCATTNKAVRILEEMSTALDLHFPCSTIHKLLKLVPEQRGEKWVLRQVSEPDLSGIDLIVVDECSMIGEDLWRHLQDIPCRWPIKVLFMGDPAQLPPVGEEASPSFLIPHGSELTEVFRQGKGHPIIAYSMAIRLAMGESLPEPLLELPFPEHSSQIEIHEDRLLWQQAMLEAFQQPEARRDVDEVRALSYTNRRVALWNDLITSKIYPDKEGPFSKDQALMLTSPVTKGGWTQPWQVVMPTDEPVRLIASRAIQWRGIDLWELDVCNLEHTIVTVTYVPPQLQYEVDKELERWREERIGKISPLEKIEKWKRHCVKVQAASAITIHRSQGSSFGTVFLDLPSIRKCREAQQSLQLLYVAVTRARKKLVILLQDEI